MEKNENKKRLFKNKKITVIAVITVVLLICVTVVAIIVPKLIDGIRDEVIAQVTEEQKVVKENISSSALTGMNFTLNTATSITSSVSPEVITVLCNFSRNNSDKSICSYTFADSTTANWFYNTCFPYLKNGESVSYVNPPLYTYVENYSSSTCTVSGQVCNCKGLYSAYNTATWGSINYPCIPIDYLLRGIWSGGDVLCI